MDLNPRSFVLGQEIRAEMARQRVSVQAIAETLGVFRHTARRKLNGESPITIDELGRVAARLNVSAADLITRADRTAA